MSNKVVLPENVTSGIEGYMPSLLQPNILFHFTNRRDWILEALERKMLSARYRREELQYFDIPMLPRVAYPMKCFCNINLSSLQLHMDWYGPYGISFAKEWGIARGIQPVQYINGESNLCKDMSSIMQIVMADVEAGDYFNDQILGMCAFILHQMAYWKPYQGMERKWLTGNIEPKCFSDESEWRFIPDLHGLDMPHIIYNEKHLLDGYLKECTDALANQEKASLVFEYKDVKHIIVPSQSDYIEIEKRVKSWDINRDDCCILLSKIIIWDDVKGDF